MNSTKAVTRAPNVDSDWLDLAIEWQIRPDSIYLNHGSFGPSPNRVRFARQKWIQALDEQPMDFYVRLLEDHLLKAREKVAKFVGAQSSDLVFVENCTYGMNVVAESISLESGDEVLLNNHEYGAVHRIFERRAARSGARVVSAKFPQSIDSKDEIVQCLLNAATEKTRLVVISHITSATALIMPVKEICTAFAQRGIPVCVDGPHAPAQIDVDIQDIGCDFYTASLHKWLCAPLGTGFLYVHPRQQKIVQPIMKSWGRLLPAMPEKWDEEFTWMGTRDPSGYLAVPDAIDFMQEVGLESFRERTYGLAAYAEQKVIELFGTQPLASREKGWYGSMAHVPLPDDCDWSHLQQQIWEEFQIEVPIIDFDGRWFVRVSCHLYNIRKQIDTLISALENFNNPLLRKLKQ